MSVIEFDYPQIDMKLTGCLLRKISKQKGITVREIQEALGLSSNQAVYDWFNGKTLPTLNNFYALSRLFCMSMEMMLVIEGRFTEEQMAVIFKDDRQILRIMEYRKYYNHMCA